MQMLWYFLPLKNDFDNIPSISPMCMKCRPACTDSANRLLWRDSATKRQVWESALKLPTRLCGRLHLELKSSELDLQSTQHQKRSIRRFCSLRNLLNWLVNQVRSWKYTANDQIIYFLIKHQSFLFCFFLDHTFLYRFSNSYINHANNTQKLAWIFVVGH
mgnify:CR=1 FL=1